MTNNFFYQFVRSDAAVINVAGIIPFDECKGLPISDRHLNRLRQMIEAHAVWRQSLPQFIFPRTDLRVSGLSHARDPAWRSPFHALRRPSEPLAIAASILDAKNASFTGKQPVHVGLAPVALGLLFLNLKPTPRGRGVLPRAPCRYVLESRSANVKHANARCLALIGILQKQNSDAVPLRHVCAIDLVLAAHVLEPFGNSVVVRRDPTSDGVEGPLLVKAYRFASLDTHSAALFLEF